MTIPVYQVDSFSSEPFGGNPAGVCLLPAKRDEGWMRQVAREWGLPAVAFVQPADGEVFDLRWFTTKAELELCGHGTLAAAHVLWQTGRLAAAATARFRTRGGALGATRADGWIELDFPAAPVEEAPAPPDLLEGLALTPRYVGRSRFDYLLELKDEDAVRTLQPDLARIRGVATRGVIVTARSSGSEYDFVSRFFAPAVGIDEDSVTGSAHCALVRFWSERLGKTAFQARQLSPRGGVLKVRLDGERALLAGQAVTVLRGELLA
jgi:PhzF family phenazine biosynthesis protein